MADGITAIPGSSKESLSQFLWETKFRKAQRMMLPRAKASDIVTEEDVFREIS